MADIVERLRAPAYWMSGSSAGHEGENNAPLEAADEITRLRAALRPLACTCPAKHQAECSRSEIDCPFWNARAALGGKDD